MLDVQRVAMVAIAAVLGCHSGKPAETPPDPKIKQLEQELATAKSELAKEHEAAEALRKDDAELKTKADEAQALQDKLAAAVGQAGEVTTADGAVKLQLVDQILFPTGEADLTPSGKDVLTKVGSALKEITDKQIWVQGHTDDQPIVPRKPKPEPPKTLVARTKPAKKVESKVVAREAKPVVPATNDAVLPFVTNWELSAARALTVVHFLQDDAKLDPTRLAAVAFGQYRPISKTKAKNRRIEIVLYPRAKIAPK